MSFIGRTTILRPDGVTSLTDKDIRRVARSAFATHAHESHSALRLHPDRRRHPMSGVFRLVCLNGVIVADREVAQVRVPHKGDVVRGGVKGSYAVLDDARRALDAEAWRGVTLSRDEQQAFGEAARVLRLGDAEGRTDAKGCHRPACRRARDGAALGCPEPSG